MNKLVERELEKYILLTKKNPVDNERSHKVMIAGLEAMLSCLKDNEDVDEVVNELYKHLDNQKKTLDEYVELSQYLDKLNAPITASEIQYLIAGIDSFKDSQEFLDEVQNDKFDFLGLLKVFSKFSADAANLSSSSEAEIDSKYPGLSEDMDFTTPEGKKISRKYKFLAKFFKILAQILVMRAYILNAVAGASKVLDDRLKNLYRSEVDSLRSLQKSVDKTIRDISKSIKDIEGKASGILNAEYDRLVDSRRELQNIANKLEYQVKVEIISDALHNKHEVFAPILDPKNREVFIKIAESNVNHKQDQFTGLTGILNTRSDLSPLRNAMREIFQNNINDLVIISVFAACVAIAREVDRSRGAFEDRISSQRMNNVGGVAPAAV